MTASTFNNKIEGHVKVEKIVDNSVVDVLENHNTVVHDSNKILSRILSSPIETKIVNHIYTGETTELVVPDSSYYECSIPYYGSAVIKKDVNFTDININESENLQKYEFQLSESEIPVDSIISAELLDSSSAVLYTFEVSKDIFIADYKTGLIGIVNDLSAYADADILRLRFYQRVNFATKIVEGSEVVYAGDSESVVEKFDRHNESVVDRVYYPDGDPLTNNYGINYKTGKLYFDDNYQYVRVEYNYEIAPGVNYMGLSDKPDSHTDGVPVSITKDSHLYATELDNEYLGSRNPINFPCEYSFGVERAEPVQHIVNFDGYKSATIDIGEPILSLEYIEEVSGETPIQLSENNDYNYKSSGEITFYSNVFSVYNNIITFKKDSSAFSGTNVYATYNYYNSATGSTETYNEEFLIDVASISSGTTATLSHTPTEGTVKLLVGDATNKTVYTESRRFSIKYTADTSAVVNFVTTFPNGFIKPRYTKKTDMFSETSSYVSGNIYSLSKDIYSITQVRASATYEGAYAVLTSGTDYTIENGNILIAPDGSWPVDGNGDPYSYFEVDYTYYQEEFGVYEVGMFDGMNPDESMMFAMAGIGPVVVDQNTGLRITWSVNFKDNSNA